VRGLQVTVCYLLVAVGLAGCGGGKPAAPEPPRFLVGAVEDAAKAGGGDAKMAKARRAGLRAIVLSAVWTPPLERPPAAELAALRGAVGAAVRHGIRPFVAVYSFGGSTPVTDPARAQFAAYAASIPRALPAVRDVIVGNEPNLELFWRPQFGPAGEDAAARDYALLLEQTYDALKAVSDDVRVICCGLAPRGKDDPDARRLSHSPVAFVRDLGAALGGERPLDAFSMHVYGESSRVPPDLAHPSSDSIGLADHAKLASLLRDAFGEDVPVLYGEYGVETEIPPEQAAAYTGSEPASTGAVDEQTQARSYRQAIRMAACQDGVEGLFLFHVFDEPQLERLQSGLYYADGTPKSSLGPVSELARAAAAGEIQCPS